MHYMQFFLFNIYIDDIFMIEMIRGKRKFIFVLHGFSSLFYISSLTFTWNKSNTQKGRSKRIFVSKTIFKCHVIKFSEHFSIFFSHQCSE